jgi:hypothetical protein
MSLTVSQAVWLAPAVTAVHFLEERSRFASWARRHISNRYTDEHWRRIHVLGMLSALGLAALVSWAPRPVTVFLFTSLYLAPMLFNLVFHAGASFWYRSYSPGLFSAFVLFPLLFWYLTSAFAGAGLLPTEVAMAATAAGAALHSLDLVSTTFFVTRPTE